MKRIIALVICLLLAVGAFTFVSCNDSGDDTTDTAAQSEAATTVADVTSAETKPETAPETDGDVTTAEEATEEATEEETQADGDETTVPAVAEGDIVIASKEDFINFNQTFVEKCDDPDWDGYMDTKIVFTADIDMDGYNWIPIDGYFLDNVTFDGQGHKISNFTSDYQAGPKELDYGGNFGGYGLIKNAYYDVTFKDLKFDTPVIKAYQKHAGVLIGGAYNGAYITIENVDMEDVRVEGWMPNEANENDFGITIRDSAYVGAIFAGCMIEFRDCNLVGAYICGFHNQACFLGYDGSATVDATCFENCSAMDVEYEFSYCQSETYDASRSYKFVSVFYNSTQWLDNIDEVKDNGNVYSNITAKDWTTGSVYDIDNFRSWTEDSESFAQYRATGSFSGIQ